RCAGFSTLLAFDYTWTSMTDPSKYTTAVITERRNLAADLWILRLNPEVGIDFRPGQYITLGLEIDNRIVERPYSVVSAPTDSHFELFIERVPAGALSQSLYEIKEGDQVWLRRRAKGLFLKEAPVAGHSHLLVATVTGVAPFLSMLRSLKE